LKFNFGRSKDNRSVKKSENLKGEVNLMKKAKRQRREEREGGRQAGIEDGSDDEICTSFTKKSNLHEGIIPENPELDPGQSSLPLTCVY
jgi:hypothetical protein